MKPATEFKIVSLRETPTGDLADEPDAIAAYFRQHITTALWYDEMKECLVGITLNARKRVTGFYLIALGTLDTVNVHPREVFRPAIIKGAHSIVICHNHPSGDSTPSDEDFRITRLLIKAAEILKIGFIDHIVIGKPSTENTAGFHSLRALGYFY